VNQEVDPAPVFGGVYPPADPPPLLLISAVLSEAAVKSVPPMIGKNGPLSEFWALITKLPSGSLPLFEIYADSTPPRPLTVHVPRILRVLPTAVLLWMMGMG
jgi:hypothetical protein